MHRNTNGHKYKNFSEALWKQIREALAEEQKSGQIPVAAFDADGTLWDTDLGENFFRYQIANCQLPNLPENPWEHYRRWKDSGDPRPAYLWLAQINAGQPLATVREWADRAFAQVDKNCVFEDTKNLIGELQASGVKVFIVTASVKWAVEPGARYLGLSNDQVIGIEVASRGPHQILQSEPSGHMTYREGKPKALKSVAGTQPFICVGNSTGDTQLLASAKRIALAVGAARADDELFEVEEKLRQEARANNWLIHQFR